MFGVLAALVLLGGCVTPTPSDTATVRVGADVLARADFDRFDGKRVGLIVNQTSRVGSEHLADLLARHPRVELTALFGPEHGIRGDADAGMAVEDGVDPATGVPVYSLYGSRREPPAEVLDNLDVLVFDIQDIGARFYTYIATMGLAMQAAARAGVPFVVLDRPNPLGGEQVDGFVLEPGFESFVGPFPIPVQHGMTVGELARMAVGEVWLEGLSALELHVVPVEGWTRSMRWPAYGDDWVPTSPNIPTFEAALVYPGMCFFEATTLNEGRGTDTPFLLIGHPDLDAAQVLAGLGGLAGVSVDTVHYAPRSIPGRSTNPRFRDATISGIRISVVDPDAVRPLALGVILLDAALDALPERRATLRQSSMDRLSGTNRLYEALVADEPAERIIDAWAAEVTRFREARAPYLLYDESARH